MAASHVSLPVAPAVLSQGSYTGLGRRTAAHLIDMLIAFAVVLAAGFFMRWLRALGVWTVQSRAQESDPIVLWHRLSGGAQLAVIVAFIVSMGPIYSGLFQASAWQASMGKRLLDIYVTDTAGNRLGLARSLGRSFAKDFFNCFYVGFVSILTILGAPRKQALHDYAAKTVVVNGRPPGSSSPELWRIVAGFGIQFLWFAVTMVALFRTES
jgi:uncharacterized RDD family membrane protein YckC